MDITGNPITFFQLTYYMLPVGVLMTGLLWVFFMLYYPPEKKIIQASSAPAGILKEAENHDLVIIGASEEGFIDQFAFGSIPQRIASQAPNSSVMVKGFSGAPEFWFRKTLGLIFDLLV